MTPERLLIAGPVVVFLLWNLAKQIGAALQQARWRAQDWDREARGRKPASDKDSQCIDFDIAA
ncbi:hypothetical protein [uncultured Paludibaculum sp.]|uniref:hypothetical protein n=1 Tax=uncultured Paludibaculum sp. TaxID=1765020 RepID=UPI002AAB98C5|nr:hypothetical protein [uncultured Paludibaculum sp.]